ncbi:hypothetical protein R80B4_00395 [Fibrobacteres bacterium R8-0-B4]
MIKLIIVIFLLICVPYYSSGQRIDGRSPGEIRPEAFSLVHKPSFRVWSLTGVPWGAEWKYKTLFGRSIPYCSQCSDLELALVLEIAIRKNSALPDTIVSQFAGTEDPAVKARLEDVAKAYSDKFKMPPPWWWVCSDEERLKRLEDAVNGNAPYPYYFLYDRHKAYMLGMLMAEYEMQFKTVPPDWQCSDMERLWRLQRILGIPSPYLTREETSAYDAKFKTDHVKKFKAPVRDYELSIVGVVHRKRVERVEYLTIDIIRTQTGAVARKTSPNSSKKLPISKTLSYNDWLNIINALSKCHVDEWQKFDEAVEISGKRCIGSGFDYLYGRIDDCKEFDISSKLENEWNAGIDIYFSDGANISVGAHRAIPSKCEKYLEAVSSIMRTFGE